MIIAAFFLINSNIINKSLLSLIALHAESVKWILLVQKKCLYVCLCMAICVWIWFTDLVSFKWVSFHFSVSNSTSVISCVCSSTWCTSSSTVSSLQYSLTISSSICTVILYDKKEIMNEKVRQKLTDSIKRWAWNLNNKKQWL